MRSEDTRWTFVRRARGPRTCYFSPGCSGLVPKSVRKNFSKFSRYAGNTCNVTRSRLVFVRTRPIYRLSVPGNRCIDNIKSRRYIDYWLLFIVRNDYYWRSNPLFNLYSLRTTISTWPPVICLSFVLHCSFSRLSVLWGFLDYSYRNRVLVL